MAQATKDEKKQDSKKDSTATSGAAATATANDATGTTVSDGDPSVADIVGDAAFRYWRDHGQITRLHPITFEEISDKEFMELARKLTRLNSPANTIDEIRAQCATLEPVELISVIAALAGAIDAIQPGSSGDAFLRWKKAKFPGFISYESEE